MLGFFVLVLSFVAIETRTLAFVWLVAPLRAFRTVRVRIVVYLMRPRGAGGAFSPVVVAEFTWTATRAVDGSVQRRYTISGTLDTRVDLSVVLVLVLS